MTLPTLRDYSEPAVTPPLSFRAPAGAPDIVEGAARTETGLAEYHFDTEWDVPAPVQQVFEVIGDSLRWPEWWRGIRSVTELTDHEPQGIGNRRQYVFRSFLPYDLVFVMQVMSFEEPVSLVGHATGELEGEGRWTFTATPSGTRVRYQWDVRTTRWWMNLLAPVARPVFTWNHGIVMRWGEAELRRRLGVA